MQRTGLLISNETTIYRLKRIRQLFSLTFHLHCRAIAALFFILHCQSQVGNSTIRSLNVPLIINHKSSCCQASHKSKKRTVPSGGRTISFSCLLPSSGHVIGFSCRAGCTGRIHVVNNVDLPSQEFMCVTLFQIKIDENIFIIISIFH